MKFVSTRMGEVTSLDDALVRGMAGDGGLFVPQTLPKFELHDFSSAENRIDTARILLEPFFDESLLRLDLGRILDETFSFAIPLTELPVAVGNALLLELFHGPTAAFKDVGARFLAACLSRHEGDAEKPLTILVATSGDTGGAVAAAFDERPGMRVVVLYPEGRVTERQARQLTCWGSNVLALAVKGSFDDCQSLVKQAMADAELTAKFRLSSANSINIGRLLPQCTYYAQASLEVYRKTGRKPGFIIPTGNLGNGLACILARCMGLPIGDIVLSSNANRLIADYLHGAKWLPRASIPTLASAMDVGNPGNMERLIYLLGDADSLNDVIRSVSVSDDQIERQIAEDFRAFGFATCPHTATATFTYRQLDDEERRDTHWIVVATAHPAKFEQIVEPLIGDAVPLPDSLRAILSRPVRSKSIEPDLKSLVDSMDANLPAAAGDK